MVTSKKALSLFTFFTYFD